VHIGTDIEKGRIESQFCMYCNSSMEIIQLGKYYALLSYFHGGWTEIEMDMVHNFERKCSIPRDRHNAWNWFKGRNIYTAWNVRKPYKIFVNKVLPTLFEQVGRVNLIGNFN
jgi:hypothetical protein